jgi:hydroxyacid-oxoacid transhydrogenase
LERPAYQGRNPFSDVFALWALKETVKMLPRVAANPEGDKEAKSQMLLASSMAGTSFGSAGVHLCHGCVAIDAYICFSHGSSISYPISGLNKKYGKYQHEGYAVDYPIVPHGISVALTGPAVFEFTAPSSPDRHREVAGIFNLYQPDGVQDERLSDGEIGQLLKDRISRFLVGLGVPRGLKAIGCVSFSRDFRSNSFLTSRYGSEHVQELVAGSTPQRRVLDLAPGMKDADLTEPLTKIIENSMSF